MTNTHSSTFNSQLSAIRKMNLGGVYDVHTNMMQYPSIMQPTYARIEQIIQGQVSAEVSGDIEAEPSSRIFPPLKPVVARNFLVTDIHLQTPPVGIAPSSYERPFQVHGQAGQGDFLAPFRGLGAVSDEIKDLLPPECREAFNRAAVQEKAWHERWGTEARDKCRREPVIDKAVVPYSMMQ